MIAKDLDTLLQAEKQPTAVRLAAQQVAEQLAGAFATSTDTIIFNDLRLAFKNSQDVVTLDHIVLYSNGFIIINSSSLVGKVKVDETGTWLRSARKGEETMESPSRLLERQQRALRKLLYNKQSHIFTGKRAKQLDIEAIPCSLLVVVGEGTTFYKPRNVTFEEIIKTEALVDTLKALQKEYRAKGGIFGFFREGFEFTAEELKKLQEVLLQAHRQAEPEHGALAASSAASAAQDENVEEDVGESPVVAEHGAEDRRVEPELTSSTEGPDASEEAASADATIDSVIDNAFDEESAAVGVGIITSAAQKDPACVHCGSHQLKLRLGRYGYYFRCQECKKDNEIDMHCPRCGAEAVVRRRGDEFYVVCSSGEHESFFYKNPEDEDEVAAAG